MKFKKTEKVQINRYFNSEEFNCSCLRCDETLIDTALTEFLELIRGIYGAPITITSGYRCEAHNANIGGVEFSTHTRGMAADIVAEDLDKLKVVVETLADKYSVGIYDEFVHVDIRKEGRRW